MCSLRFVRRLAECQNCGGEGLDGHDCGDDCCCCMYPEDNVECQYCRGFGGWYWCMSSADWCESHPLKGREIAERGEIEWFRVRRSDGHNA